MLLGGWIIQSSRLDDLTSNTELMEEVAQINTKPTRTEGAEQMVSAFFDACKKEGNILRAEHLKTISGQRIVLVFDYDALE